VNGFPRYEPFPIPGNEIKKERRGEKQRTRERKGIIFFYFDGGRCAPSAPNFKSRFMMPPVCNFPSDANTRRARYPPAESPAGISMEIHGNLASMLLKLPYLFLPLPPPPPPAEWMERTTAFLGGGAGAGAATTARMEMLESR